MGALLNHMCIKNTSVAVVTTTERESIGVLVLRSAVATLLPPLLVHSPVATDTSCVVLSVC